MGPSASHGLVVDSKTTRTGAVDGRLSSTSPPPLRPGLVLLVLLLAPPPPAPFRLLVPASSLPFPEERAGSRPAMMRYCFSATGDIFASSCAEENKQESGQTK
jgi:hypothetical protein